MKRIISIAALLAFCSSAFAMEYFLESEWTDSNQQKFCKYSNGTVLNIGYGVCPRSVKG